MGASVGQGILDKMAELGDSPVTHEWTEQRGASMQAKAYGKKGLYVASPDSGHWQVIVIPFDPA